MTWQLRERGGDTLVVCSVDTEEDTWDPSREGVTVRNIEELPRLSQLMRNLNVPVTYFLTHAVAADPAAGRVMRKLAAEGQSEIAAHLHPWNTPPLTERLDARTIMLNNLPASLQFSKLRRLTDRLEDVFGQAPTAFRAGRAALGSNTVDVLRRCGYTIDCSVMPYHDLRQTHGPTFLGAPNDAYCIGENGDAITPLKAGPVLEIPMSAGFSRTPFDLWDRIHRPLATRLARRFHLPGLMSRMGLVRKIALMPELETVKDMVTLAHNLISLRVSHLQIIWHSPSLLPSATPFTRTVQERDSLLQRITQFIERLRQDSAVRFVTVSQAAAALAEKGPVDPVSPTRPG